jgi:hypothetical protein
MLAAKSPHSQSLFRQDETTLSIEYSIDSMDYSAEGSDWHDQDLGHNNANATNYGATMSLPTPSSSSIPTTVPPSPTRASPQSPSLQFCRQGDIRHNNVTLKILYQCQGSAYTSFGKQLARFAQNISESTYNNQHGHGHATSEWGRRDFPVPANRTVFVLGNSHLRQISKTVICQYSNAIQSIYIHSPVSLSNDNQEVFGVQFRNGARWISITNTVLAYSNQWYNLILQHEIWTQLGMKNGNNSTPLVVDTLIFGKFTRYSEAIGTSFFDTMTQAAALENDAGQPPPPSAGPTPRSTTALVDFVHIPPPTLVEIATAFSHLSGGLISVPMFSVSDQDRAWHEWKEYQQALAESTNASFTNHTAINKNVSLLNTRQFIEELGLECGSDNRMTIGTCQEPENDNSNDNSTTTTATTSTKRAFEMHRCAGNWGGHADLVAWSLVEELYRKNADFFE